jgi:uncharacterized membrane protein
MMTQQTANSSRRRGITFIANPVLSIILSVLLTIALKLLIERGPYQPDFWDVLWLRTIGTIAVALTGVGLFLFRKYNQLAYGASEVGSALAISWISLGRVQTANDAASWIAVVAAAYFIVRGLINCEEGKKQAVAKMSF